MDTKNTRVLSYFANLSVRRRSIADWRIYAAVTGSAMAMATNASAGVIYSDQAVTAGPLGNVARSHTEQQSQNIALKSANGGNIGFSFKVGVGQSFSSIYGGRDGFALLVSPIGGDGVGVSLLAGSTSDGIKKLAFGAHISTVHGVNLAQGGIRLASQSSTSANVRHVFGWAANETGLAGFRFTTTNHTRDYGWIRLSYTLGTNGLANSITATDWAYAATGTPITAGEVGSSTPEPSTTALAILAAGSAGVAALRRRRHELNQ